MRIVLHDADPLAAQRACVTRPRLGLVARCVGCGTRVVSGRHHVHLLYGVDQYVGCCSEGCAIRAAVREGLCCNDDDAEHP